MEPCAGCTARQEEIAHLRAQNAELMDRMLAAANPQVHAYLRSPNAPSTAALTSYVGEDGQTYVMVEGMEVKLTDLVDVLKAKGIVRDPVLGAVPIEELNRVRARMEEDVGNIMPNLPQ